MGKGRTTFYMMKTQVSLPLVSARLVMPCTLGILVLRGSMIFRERPIRHSGQYSFETGYTGSFHRLSSAFVYWSEIVKPKKRHEMLT